MEWSSLPGLRFVHCSLPETYSVRFCAQVPHVRTCLQTCPAAPDFTVTRTFTHVSITAIIFLELENFLTLSSETFATFFSFYGSKVLHRLRACFMVPSIDCVIYTFDGPVMPRRAQYDQLCKVRAKKTAVDDVSSAQKMVRGILQSRGERCETTHVISDRVTLHSFSSLVSNLVFHSFKRSLFDICRMCFHPMHLSYLVNLRNFELVVPVLSLPTYGKCNAKCFDFVRV